MLGQSPLRYTSYTPTINHTWDHYLWIPVISPTINPKFLVKSQETAGAEPLARANKLLEEAVAWRF